MYNYNPNIDVNQSLPEQQVPNDMQNNTTNNASMNFHINGQMVPNVLMDMPDDQAQQNVPSTGYMDNSQNYTGVQQTVTYELNVPVFDIEDPIMRRQFFTKVFALLLIQNILALPVMELFILCFDPIHLAVYHSFWLVGLLLFIPMYIYSDYRRYMPMNVISLVFTTIFITIVEGIYATSVGTAAAFTSQLIVIGQLLAVLIYSKQSRFKFTNINAILVIIFIKIVSIAIRGVIAPQLLLELRFWSTFNVIYCVYDIQLMLSGHHGYNLKADEHIFGVSNVYADISNIYYRFIRFTIIASILRIYEFFKSCCFAEVC